MRQRRLLWHCRRGMKELDELLSRFAKERYPSASRPQQQAFEVLLSLPDPQIAAYLLGQEAPPGEELAALIRNLSRQ